MHADSAHVSYLLAGVIMLWICSWVLPGLSVSLNASPNSDDRFAGFSATGAADLDESVGSFFFVSRFLGVFGG